MSNDGLYRVPLDLRRGTQWAIKCEGCSKECRLGPGSKAAMLRLLSVVGRHCDSCRPEQGEAR